MSLLLKNAIEWICNRKVPCMSVPRGTLLDDLRKSLNNPETSNVVFVLHQCETSSNENRFYASKWLLCLRSEHFRALLKGPMKESSQEEILVRDVSFEAFSQVMQYIYTDTIAADGMQVDLLLEVLSLADRFLLNDLKQLCEYHLVQVITCDNVIQILIQASRSNALHLREITLKFVAQNKQSLLEKPEFNELTKEPTILLEIIKIL